VGGRLLASARAVSADGAGLGAGAVEWVAVADADVVLVRTDPPVDPAYLAMTLLLEHVRDRTLVVNDPRGLREANEKLYACRFPDLMPTTVVSADRSLLRARGFTVAVLRERPVFVDATVSRAGEQVTLRSLFRFRPTTPVPPIGTSFPRPHAGPSHRSTDERQAGERPPTALLAGRGRSASLAVSLTARLGGRWLARSPGGKGQEPLVPAGCGADQSS